MHELALCQSLLRIIEATATQQMFSRVRRVRLEVGDFAGVEVESLRFAFTVASRSTRAANACLEIVPVQGAAWCGHCHDQVSVRRRFDPCPTCGQFELLINGGEELRITALEVD